MIKKYRWTIGALLIALLAVGVFGVSSVYADDEGPGGRFGKRGGRGFGGRGLEGAGLEAAAEVLGMSADELSAALKDGQKLNELAEEAGVEMQEIFDALSAVKEESMRERIAQAVEDGTMSQEKADWLLEGLDKGFLGGKGFGFGGRDRGKFQNGDGSEIPRSHPSPDAGISL